MALTNNEAEKLSSILYQLEKLRGALASRAGETEEAGVQQKLNDAGNILAHVLTGGQAEPGAAAGNPTT
jgi:hypothetical protein